MESNNLPKSEKEIGKCESCGFVGEKENFYSNTKRFCTAACSHSYSAKHRKKSTSSAKLEHSPKKKRKSVSENTSELQLPLVLPSEMDRREYSSSGFDWGKYLLQTSSKAAHVHLFPHAQMSSHWAEIDKGVKVEVLNLDCPVPTKVYWIAEVVDVAGYKALLRYEGFGDEGKCDFWCNLCTHDVHAVGWCATIGKPLVPPKTIQYKYSNWKSFLVQRLTGAKTLPNDFQQRVVQSMESPFLVNMRLEVMDKTQISRMRIGIVEEVNGGRLRLRYEDSDEANDDFWCHAGSPVIHHIGWSEKVGHKILVATKDYKNVPGFKNSKPELFATAKQVKVCGFKIGMKLEAIDPLNLSCICVATVRKVLRNGFLMIGIDGSEAINGTDWFCYNCASPSIFPVGFCEANGIKLTTPKGFKGLFSWNNYLKETDSQPAPINLFKNEEFHHGFDEGMKLEAVDLMEPRLLCVSTVARVVGRLLRIHFDGWEEQYDQWVDSQSSDIYPVGWCELVGYELQPPVNSKSVSLMDSSFKKRQKPKGQTFLGKKKRKRLPAPPIKKSSISSPSLSQEDQQIDDYKSSTQSPEHSVPPDSSNTDNKTEEKHETEHAENVVPPEENKMEVAHEDEKVPIVENTNSLKAGQEITEERILPIVEPVVQSVKNEGDKNDTEKQDSVTVEPTSSIASAEIDTHITPEKAESQTELNIEQNAT